MRLTVSLKFAMPGYGEFLTYARSISDKSPAVTHYLTPTWLIFPHLQGSAGMYGNWGCNIPQRTVVAFMEKVAELGPDFVIYTGETKSVSKKCAAVAYTCHIAWNNFGSKISRGKKSEISTNDNFVGFCSYTANSMINLKLMILYPSVLVSMTLTCMLHRKNCHRDSGIVILRSKIRSLARSGQ